MYRILLQMVNFLFQSSGQVVCHLPSDAVMLPEDGRLPHHTVVVPTSKLENRGLKKVNMKRVQGPDISVVPVAR